MTQESKNGLLVGSVGGVAALVLGVILGVVLNAKPAQPTQVNVSLPPELKLTLSSDNPLVSNQITQPATTAPAEKGVLGGTLLHVLQEDFLAGLAVNGSEVFNKLGGLAVGATTSTFSGDGYVSGVDFYEQRTLNDASSTIASVCANDGQKLLITNVKLLIPADLGTFLDAKAARFVGIYVASNAFSSSTQMLAGGTFTTSTARQWLNYDSRNLGSQSTTTIMAATNFVLTSGQCVNAWINKAASSTISTNTDGLFEVGYRKLN
jgi:hypothetical protein